MNTKTIDMVTRPPFILVMAVISVLGAVIYLANTLAEDNNTDRRAGTAIHANADISSWSFSIVL